MREQSADGKNAVSSQPLRGLGSLAACAYECGGHDTLATY
jgi:hypothetical protein